MKKKAADFPLLIVGFAIALLILALLAYAAVTQTSWFNQGTSSCENLGGTCKVGSDFSQCENYGLNPNPVGVCEGNNRICCSSG